jgi:hypothetical protein
MSSEFLCFLIPVISIDLLIPLYSLSCLREGGKKARSGTLRSPTIVKAPILESTTSPFYSNEICKAGLHRLGELYEKYRKL